MLKQNLTMTTYSITVAVVSKRFAGREPRGLADDAVAFEAMNNTVQVLTSPLNGQLYVLSNGNDVVTSESAKAVVPSVAKLQIEGSQNIVTTVKKVSYSILMNFRLSLFFI